MPHHIFYPRLQTQRRLRPILGIGGSISSGKGPIKTSCVVWGAAFMLNISLFSVPNRVRPAIPLIRFTQLRSLGQQKLYCFANFGFFRAIGGMLEFWCWKDLLRSLRELEAPHTESRLVPVYSLNHPYHQWE